MWEDPQNNHGGRWLISLERKILPKIGFNDNLDSLWLETMLCLIGEAFGLEEYGDAGNLFVR